MTVDFRTAPLIDDQRWIRWMDAEVFPDDKPVTFVGSHWWIGWVGDKPVCYAAWRPHYPMETVAELHWTEQQGFLYRAGVMPEARGQGLQRDLITLREQSMREHGIKTAVTYTDPTSAASMRSLMAVGYKPYKSDAKSNLAGVGRGGYFVHWRKDL
jgi:ribosomal protein S18 acetylase RimI-like enzyme